MQEEKAIKIVKTEHGPMRILSRTQWSEDDEAGIGWSIKINSQQFSDYKEIFLKTTVNHMSITISMFNKNVRYDICVKGSDKITVTILSGRRQLASMTVQPVNTWFTRPTELVDMIKQFGVKKTCKRILQTVIDAVNGFMERVNEAQQL